MTKLTSHPTVEEQAHDAHWATSGGEMGRLVRSTDWSKTPLGPIAQWPRSLKTMLGVVLGSRFPMMIWWGPELLNFYNDAYRPILRDKHPASLGAPAAKLWAEIWDLAGPMANGVMQGGPATWTEDLQLFINSEGIVEETYFTFSYSPVPGDDGRVGGLLNTVQETTAKVRSERQIRMLHELAVRAADAKSESDAYRVAVEVMSANELDLPFALLYALDAKAQNAHLVGASGWSAYRGPARADRVALGEVNDTGAWPLSEVLRRGGEVLIEDLAERFGALPVGRWNARPERAIALPLSRPGHAAPCAVLVAGISPHRALDERYRRFFSATADQLTAVIAAARAAEEERERSRALAEIDRAKTAFFSNVSHEFRTPLTLMLGPLEDELAERDALPPARLERIETAHRNGLRLLKLVNTLLDFARIEAGRVQAHYEPTDLATLTVDLASTFQSAMQRGGLSFTVDCAPLPQPVYVDREMWEKIVLNLLSNAFKHTFHGSIAVRLAWVDGAAQLTVQDSGVGIAEDEIPRLFRRFHRVKGAASRTHEGTGIGLSLVKELVQAHSGSITVQSELGKGSAFMVTLKAGASHLPADQIGKATDFASPGRAASAYVEEALHWLPSHPSAGAAGQALPPAIGPAAPGSRARILWADDNADMRHYVGKLLAGSYEVLSVPDGQAALEAALSAPPDLVLSDVMMPRLDGFGLLRALRADERTRHLPVILLSARAGEEAAVEGMEGGADDYLVKPFSARELLARVRAHLDLARQRRELERELEQRVEARTAEVARLSGVLQMLSGINTALVRIPNRHEVLQEACRLAQRVGGYALAMVALINPATRMARPVGWAGYEFMAQPGREFPVANHESEDSSLMGRVIRTGTSMLCEDIESFPHVISGRTEMIAAGVRSLACLPLRVDHTPVGAFLFGSRTTIVPDEMLLLEELAANLSFALQYLDKQDAVHFLSYFEPLTGLAKRSLFCERLNRLLVRGAESLPRLAVTVFDIAHLSVINASFGRHTGDRLLQCIADRVKERFPDTEQLAHSGGGTFVCVNAQRDGTVSEVNTSHEDVTRLFVQPFSVDGREIAAEVRCGVACYPDDGKEANQLVQNAEAALKLAKTSGERYLHHRMEMSSELARRVGMEHRLRGALANGQFRLHYQPKLSLRTGKIVGAEALLRWDDPENGMTSPGVFLPLLESAGLLTATDTWVLRQAAADCRDWRRRGLTPVRVAVNVSPVDLRRRNIALEILDNIGDLVSPSEWGIDIEITEGVLSGDSSSCIHALRLLRAAGVGVAIDDFGTGFSSLGRLSELPIDTLKIDRMFTSRLPTDRKSCTLVSSIIGLAHAFDMTTVAEGVENQEQLDHLVRQGCDESQGYLHSKPLPKEEFEGWLTDSAGAATNRSGLKNKIA
jgi:diguanylate cyclase (GGDEF)-like protein